jgi:hypothetical protein
MRDRTSLYRCSTCTAVLPRTSPLGLFVPSPRKVKSAYLLIVKTHSMFERMLLYMLYLCCVTGTDPAVLRAEAMRSHETKRGTMPIQGVASISLNSKDLRLFCSKGMLWASRLLPFREMGANSQNGEDRLGSRIPCGASQTRQKGRATDVWGLSR